MSLFKFIGSKTFVKQLFFAIMGVVVVVFVLLQWLRITTNHNQKIEVPNLAKMSIEDVHKTLTDLDLRFEVIDSASYNLNYPKRSVISQSPEAGDFVKEKRKIYLTLNPSKYRDVAVPDLNGKTKRQAMSHLTSIGFKVGEFSYIPDLGKDVVRKMTCNGKVLKQGDKLPKNSVIDLVLGDGTRN